jgi:hypothetical protein
MKYLQIINEKVSKVYEENLKFLTSNSGYDELESIVPDLATDVCDEFEKSQFETHAFVYLKYKRSTKSQSTNIGLNFFTKTNKTLAESEKKYLADFLSKCEHARSMDIRYVLTIEIGDIDPDKIITELQSLAEQLKSYGYTVKHTTEAYSDSEINPTREYNPVGIKDFETYVKDRCQVMKHWTKNGNPYMQKYHILIQDTIDIDLFKPGSDYLTTLPNNIISDFKEFCDRFKMNSGDREQLADLIKKAKEENPTI